MFSDTITFEDFNGDPCSETLFFNISQTEALKFEASKDGGYTAYMQEVLDAFDNVSESNDYTKLVATTKMLGIFEDIIIKAYGEKSEDGKRFMKSDEITNNFIHSAVYDAFLTKLTSDPDYALNFIIAVLPNNTGMSTEEIKAQAISSVEEQDLNTRFKAKIEEKKTEAQELPA